MDAEQLKNALTNAGCYEDKKRTRLGLFANVEMNSFMTNQVSNRLNAGWKTAQYVIVDDCNPGYLETLLEKWRSLTSQYYNQFIIVYNEAQQRYNIYNSNGELLGDDSRINEILFGKKSDETVVGGENVLYYGVPGSGKSHTIENQINGSKYERVVFHPDYTYSDFVGQVMPRLKKKGDEEKLTYEFVSGPFTKALKAAKENPKEMFYLVIEEINRGNASAIFGDIFQLLDRKEDGSGQFQITNYDIAEQLYGEGAETVPIIMPSNLTILATMNTSDQNVFTLDTAFQRRWNMQYIPNDIDAAEHANQYIDDRKEITWSDFAKFVNNVILDYNTNIASSEDKQLGAYFVKDGELNREQFAEKALKYLWDDVFKMDREQFFDPEIKSIGDLLSSYVNSDKEPLRRIMRADIYEKMMDMTAKTPADAIDDSEVFESEPVNE